MDRVFRQCKLALGALVCFGVFASITYFQLLPDWQSVDAPASFSGRFKALAPLAVIVLLWLIGGLIASYLLISSLFVLTGQTLNILGIPIRTKTAALTEIDYLDGGQFVEAVLMNKRRITISQAFDSEAAGNAALATIAEWTGLPTRRRRRRGKRR